MSDSAVAFITGASRGIGKAAGFIHVEFKDEGIRAYNIDPGYVPTEAQLAMQGKDDPIYQQYIAGGAAPEVPANMLVWLFETQDGRSRSREIFHAPSFVKKNGLLPGWPPPKKDR